jgi:hypothetical protein
MTKWIFLLFTFITLATLTNAATIDPVIQFLDNQQLSYPSQFEIVFSCNHKTKNCVLISSDENVRELKGPVAQEAIELMEFLGMDPQATYVNCKNKSCRMGNIPDAII